MISQTLCLNGVETKIKYWSHGRECYIEEITQRGEKIKIESAEQLDLIEKLIMGDILDAEVHFHESIMTQLPSGWGVAHDTRFFHRRSVFLIPKDFLQNG